MNRCAGTAYFRLLHAYLFDGGYTIRRIADPPSAIIYHSSAINNQ